MTWHLSGSIADRFCTWALEGPTITIGRSSKSGIQVADATVSKDHAEIKIVDGKPTIRDLGSRNGTRVNGAYIQEPVPLSPGDQVHIGHVPLMVSDQVPSPPTRFTESTSLSSSLKIPLQKILDAPNTVLGSDAAEVMHLLTEAGQMLVLPRSIEELSGEILKIVEKAVPSTRLILLLLKESELVQVAARYQGGNASQPLVLSKSIMNRVLEECTAILTTDAAVDPRFLGQQSIVSLAVHSAIAVPLFDNEKVLGILYADSHDLRTAYNQHHLEIMTLLANMAAVKITNLGLLEAEQIRARMVQELSTARTIQRSLLPAEPPQLEGYDVEVYLETCYEVGGDLYDFSVAPDGTLMFLLGDVSGKGMGAAMLMSSVMASARVLCDTCVEPEDIMNRLNAIVHRSTDSGHFVTAFLGRLEPATGLLKFVNAGHNPPYLMVGGDLVELEATGIPVGMLPGIKYDAQTVQLPKGGLLTLYTDGIPEARAAGGEFYEEERFKKILLERTTESTPAEMCRQVITSVNDFLAGEHRGDDITLMVIHRKE